MRLYRIVGESAAWLDNVPETAMGVHVLAPRGGERPDLMLALSGQIAMPVGPAEDLDAEGFLELTWLSSAAGIDDRRSAFADWLERLETMWLDADEWAPISRGMTGYRVNTMGPLPAPPRPAATVYGHLPFLGITGPDDAVYRWEASPLSRRIDQATGKVAPGTFTAPLAEVPFMPTGLDAVARLALPVPLPACFRWELRPPAGTVSRCGACVPLFGQSGGGVEIAFQHGFANAGPIANPVALPAL